MNIQYFTTTCPNDKLTGILGVPIHEQEILYYELQVDFELELIS